MKQQRKDTQLSPNNQLKISKFTFFKKVAFNKLKQPCVNVYTMQYTM